MDDDERNRLIELHTPAVHEEIRLFYAAGNPHTISEESLRAVGWVYFNCYFSNHIEGSENVNPEDLNGIRGLVRVCLGNGDPARYPELGLVYRAYGVGERPAFTRFYAVYYPRLKGLAKGLLWSKSGPRSAIRADLDVEAHDCVTFSLNRTTSPLREYRAEASPYGVLKTSVVNAGLRRLMKRRITAVSIEGFEQQVESDTSGRLDLKRFKVALRKCMAMLNESHYALLSDYFKDGMILEALRVKYGKSSAQTSRDIKKICLAVQKLLAREGFPDSDVKGILGMTDEW